MVHATDRLIDLALQGAEEDPHAAACPACRAELRALREVLARVALAEAPVLPSPSVLERVMASVAPGRFDGVVDQLARFFDVTRERARALVERMDTRWLPGPSDGIALQAVKAGPRLAGAWAGFIRLAPGVPFPAHRHLGPESMLVLEGAVRQHDGRVIATGATLDSAPGSAHAFVVADDHECVAAIVQFGGMEFGILLPD